MSEPPSQDAITLHRELVQLMADLLDRDHDEFTRALPRSLGYDFTHTPDIERVLQTLKRVAGVVPKPRPDSVALDTKSEVLGPLSLPKPPR